MRLYSRSMQSILPVPLVFVPHMQRLCSYWLGKIQPENSLSVWQLKQDHQKLNRVHLRPSISINYEFFKWSEIQDICGQSRLHGGMYFSKAVPAGEELASLIVKKAGSARGMLVKTLITLPFSSRPGLKLLRRWRSWFHNLERPQRVPSGRALIKIMKAHVSKDFECRRGTIFFFL